MVLEERLWLGPFVHLSRSEHGLRRAEAPGELRRNRAHERLGVKRLGVLGPAEADGPDTRAL